MMCSVEAIHSTSNFFWSQSFMDCDIDPGFGVGSRRSLCFSENGGKAMKIPEHLRIPMVVFALQAALLAGCSLIFLVLLPNGI